MKTGTTALASFLTKSARAGHLPEDMVYPVDDQWWPKEGAIHKHQVLVAIGGMNPARVGGRRRTLKEPEEVMDRLRQLVEDQRASAAERVNFFFVCEGAENYLDAELLARNLHSIFDEVAFVIVTRDQVQSVASRLSHGIKVLDVEMVSPSRVVRYARQNLSRGRFDFGRFVERWNSLGAELVVVPYFEDDIGTYDLIDRVLDACAITPPPREDGIEGRRIHPALTPRALWVLWFYKSIHTRARSTRLRAWALRSYEASKLRSQREVMELSSAARPWRPSDRQAREIREIYRESNEKFALWLGDRRTETEWQRWFASLRG
jgi:hypothetical protein